MRYLWMASLWWLAACDRPAPQSQDFDQTCEVADDCAVVFNNPNTCGCSCGTYDAINAAELESWTEEFDTFTARQRCRESCLLGCTYAEAYEPTCDAGTCAALAVTPDE